MRMAGTRVNGTHSPFSTFIVSYKNHCEVIRGPTMAMRTGRLRVNKLKRPIFFTAWVTDILSSHYKTRQKSTKSKNRRLEMYLHYTICFSIVKWGDNIIRRVRNNSTESTRSITCKTCDPELLHSRTFLLGPLKEIFIDQINGVLKGGEHHHWDCGKE